MREKSSLVNLKINNRRIQSQEGNTIFKAAGQNEIYIPTLCYHPEFPPQANCGVCLVEIITNRGLQIVTSCSTSVCERMEIHTDTPKVQSLRKTNLELLFTNHIGRCAKCSKKDNCELLKLAVKYKINIRRFEGKILKEKIDKSGKVIRDMSKCIRCRRCIDVCKKYGTDVLAPLGKGFEIKITTEGDMPLAKSKCSGCKQCALYCPVGAIYTE